MNDHLGRAAYLTVGAMQLVLLAAISQAEEGRRTAVAEILPAIVRVQTVANAADVASPWQHVGVERYEGSGVIIDGNRILTNAHVVADAVSVTVKREGMIGHYEAKVTQLGHECDLALLDVADAAFFKGTKPLPLGELAGLRDRVDVYGFPVGGESISITSGIVSRVELSEYANSHRSLLAAQIDASLNEGNSGGPVVADGKIVGIAVQYLEDAENVGYMVPAPVLRHFLTDVADGRYDGFPALGADLQSVANPGLRSALGLAAGQNGALITRLGDGTTAAETLRPGDVVLAIDGLTIGEDLSVDAPGVGRISAEYALHTKQVGEQVELTIVREGERLTVRARLQGERLLVPGPRYESAPSYLIFAGLVFQPLGAEFIDLYEEPPSDMANYYLYQNLRTPDRHQVIVLSQVLAAGVNRGYHDAEGLLVKTVEGRVPRDMAHLAELVDTAAGPTLDIVTEEGRRIAVELERAKAASTAILQRYDVKRARSAELPGGE